MCLPEIKIKSNPKEDQIKINAFANAVGIISSMVKINKDGEPDLKSKPIKIGRLPETGCF